MNEVFRKKAILIFQVVPEDLYIGLICAFIFGLIVFCDLYGIKKGLKFSAGLLLVEYIVLLLSSTVLFRTTNLAWRHDFIPFGSYKAMFDGLNEFLADNLLNSFVFLPIGFLLGVSCKSIKWWVVLLIGFGISFTIEFLQFILHRGYAQFDDVLHNLIVCLIGYGLLKIILN